MSRKDMEVYGTEGLAVAVDGSRLQLRMKESDPVKEMEVSPLPPDRNDPFAFLAGVVRGEIVMEPYDPSSLENNMIVMEILEEARINSGQYDD